MGCHHRIREASLQPVVHKSIRFEGPIDDLFKLPCFVEAIEIESPGALDLFDLVHERFHTWNADPSLDVTALWYGTGFGLCGEQARVLTGLWSEYGIISRIVATQKHVMTEYRYGESWRACDPQHGVVFVQNGVSLATEDLRKPSAWSRSGLDPVGYDNQTLIGMISSGELAYLEPTVGIPSPRLKISAHQMATLRPRFTDATSLLPLTQVPATQHRTHVIPLYELVVETQFNPEQPEVLLDCRLPIIDVEWQQEQDARVTNAGKTSTMSPAAVLSLLSSGQRSLHLALTSGSTLKVTYLLSGWLGDRILSFEDDDHEENHAIVNVLVNAPSFYVGRIGFEPKSSPPKLTIEIEWRDVRLRQPEKIRVNVDQLSADMSLEVWHIIGGRDWVWRPEFGRNGRAELFFDWPPADRAPPYRSPQIRTVQVSLVNRWIQSGRNHALLRFEE